MTIKNWGGQSKTCLEDLFLFLLQVMCAYFPINATGN